MILWGGFEADCFSCKFPVILDSGGLLLRATEYLYDKPMLVSLKFTYGPFEDRHCAEPGGLATEASDVTYLLGDDGLNCVSHLGELASLSTLGLVQHVEEACVWLSGGG